MFIDELELHRKQFVSIRDNTKAVAFGNESDEQRLKSFEELEKATG